jgi:hypothetical protein
MRKIIILTFVIGFFLNFPTITTFAFSSKDFPVIQETKDWTATLSQCQTKDMESCFTLTLDNRKDNVYNAQMKIFLGNKWIGSSDSFYRTGQDLFIHSSMQIPNNTKKIKVKLTWTEKGDARLFEETFLVRLGK